MAHDINGRTKVSTFIRFFGETTRIFGKLHCHKPKRLMTILQMIHKFIGISFAWVNQSQILALYCLWMANVHFHGYSLTPTKNDWKFSAWMMIWLLTHQTTTNCVIHMIHYKNSLLLINIKVLAWSFWGFPLTNLSWEHKLCCRFFKRWIFKQNKHRKKDICIMSWIRTQLCVLD